MPFALWIAYPARGFRAFIGFLSDLNPGSPDLIS